MARRLARSWWIAGSMLVATSAWAQTSVPAGKPQMTVEQAADPAYVTQWLKTHSPKDQLNKTTRRAFDQANKADRGKNWSAAALAYGESMVRYPLPQALAGYARTTLLMRGEERARKGELAANAKADVAYSLRYYDAALAANDVVITLGPDEEPAAKQQAQCLREFVASTQMVSECEPVKSYLASGR